MDFHFCELLFLIWQSSNIFYMIIGFYFGVLNFANLSVSWPSYVKKPSSDQLIICLLENIAYYVINL